MHTSLALVVVADNEEENPTVPVTDKVLHGVVVPMPTLPLVSNTIF